MTTTTQTTTELLILEAAATLFYEKGYHGTSMRDIAAAVGVKAASLYNYYPSKESLLIRVCAGTMEELLDGGRKAIAEWESPEERLRALLIWHVVYHATRRFQARVADEQIHAISKPNQEVVLIARDAYTQLFKDILTDGEIRHGWHVPSVSVLTFGIGGMCTYVDTWYREEGLLSPEQIAQIYADFILCGLGPD